ncbi:MAG: Holliday junction resolvase RuvX [Clostridia bacterium]|nr:Holliday junction resolvase RuvX [Clostridia bacterium]
MRAIGIDFGLVRIGIAFSDEMKILATPFDTYRTKDFDSDIEYFANLINEKKVDTIVIGLPKNMKGEEQEIAHKTKEFAENLQKKTQRKLIYIDERLTSVYVDRIMISADVKWQDRKKMIDKLSAATILQNYLDRK